MCTNVKILNKKELWLKILINSEYCYNPKLGSDCNLGKDLSKE